MNTHDPTNQSDTLEGVEFVKSITGEDPILEKVIPHIVFAGRSNAGKSSVINAVSGSSLAKVSQKPGKTQTINFYTVGADKAYLVDLPGYGYAKMSAKEADTIRRQMIWYLGQSEAPIALLVLVVDIRRGLQDIDNELLDIAAGEQIPTVIVANKVDKCNQSERVHNRRQLQEQVNERLDVRPDLLEFSAQDGTGVDQLSALISQYYGN
jgi:GTP-binding protein